MVADFRRIGMDSIDPNLDEVTWDLSYINMEGFHVRVAYSLTDSLVGSLNFSHSWQLRGITGGEATGGAALANAKAVDVLQLDMNLKF
jgi:hypothetical protein